MYTQQRLKSACVSEQFDQSTLSIWRKFASLAIQNMPSDDSDQTAWMCRLTWFLAGFTSKVTFSDTEVHILLGSR